MPLVARLAPSVHSRWPLLSLLRPAHALTPAQHSMLATWCHKPAGLLSQHSTSSATACAIAAAAMCWIWSATGGASEAELLSACLVQLERCAAHEESHLRTVTCTSLCQESASELTVKQEGQAGQEQEGITARDGKQRTSAEKARIGGWQATWRHRWRCACEAGLQLSFRHLIAIRRIPAAFTGPARAGM